MRLFRWRSDSMIMNMKWARSTYWLFGDRLPVRATLPCSMPNSGLAEHRIEQHGGWQREWGGAYMDTTDSPYKHVQSSRPDRAPHSTAWRVAEGVGGGACMDTLLACCYIVSHTHRPSRGALYAHTHTHTHTVSGLSRLPGSCHGHGVISL